MAQVHSIHTFLLIHLLLALSVSAKAEKLGFLQSVKPAPKTRHEKLSHFHFYWHDVLSGRDPTSVPIARASITNTSATLFGVVYVIDDLLTAGPEKSSRPLGRAQGLYASADKDVVGLLMTMNFVFTEGKYNGSTLTVLGRNSVLDAVREMPVVAGSGLFRFARGYCKARTIWFDPKSGDATVEYNVYVIHY